MHNIQPGELTAAFASDQGIILGTEICDDKGNWYRWVKRISDTLAANKALVSLGTARARGTNEVKLPTADDQPFEGARVSGADSLDATNPYGWIQIAGQIVLTSDNSVVVDDLVSIVGTVGKIKRAAAPAQAKYRFGVAHATQNVDGGLVTVSVPRQG